MSGAYYRTFDCADCSAPDGENVLCNLCYGEHLKIAREQEREACAKVADAAAVRWDKCDLTGFRGEVCRDLAEDIRARGKP